MLFILCSTSLSISAPLAKDSAESVLMKRASQGLDITACNTNCLVEKRSTWCRKARRYDEMKDV